VASIYEIIDEVVNLHDQAILATVIHVEGSAYRKEGATMLFTNAGEQLGVISAGCLETDLATQADERLKEDNFSSCIVVYDMSAEDDLSWGRGAGCNGKIHILLEKITSKIRNEFCILRDQLKEDHEVISVRFLQNNRVNKTCYLANAQIQFGDKTQAMTTIIPTLLTTRKSRLENIEGFSGQMYIQYFQPKPRLFVFGAGVDVRPLASFAVTVGFAVTVWDWRPNHCNQTYFPEVTILENRSIPQLINSLNFTHRDSVIIMTHDFQKDKEILHLLLKEAPLHYLGILGPRKRTTRLLDGEQIPAHLHSPVGLSIGAEGPEEIAISIIADLIQMRRKS